MSVSAQNVTPAAGERIVVRGGLAEVGARNRGGVELARMTPDSLYFYMRAIDSLRNDGVRFDRGQTDSIVTSMIDRTSPTGDTLTQLQMAELVAQRRQLTLNSSMVRHFMGDPAFVARYIDGGTDTLLAKLVPPDTLSRREKRRLARLDTAAVRYNKFFRDSMPLSRTVAISMVLPGFAQFYNEDYWKIPVIYGGMAAGIGLWAKQTKLYKPLKTRYEEMYAHRVNPGEDGYEAYKAEMTSVQTDMIRRNTDRQLAMGFAIASYMYGLVDGTISFPGEVDHVKKATTLSTVFPGAGQVYNGNYWKLPIVVGGGAVLFYVINWNNRSYERFKTAYNYLTDGDDSTVDEFDGEWSATQLQNFKNQSRRNRDLCIILSGLFYVIQIVDAHATAHMKTYDVSDDLARVSFEPMMDRLYSQRAGGAVDTFGFSFNVRF